MWRRPALLMLLLAAVSVHAEEGPAAQVQLNGLLGTRAALLLIDGEAKTVAVGSSVKGVKLLSVEEERAVIETGGRRQTLQMGALPARIDASATAQRQIVLAMGPGGHYTTLGTINGRTTSFLLDTGATNIAIGQAEADRLGLRYTGGKRVMTQTANGFAPGYQMQLASVRIGEVEVRDVTATIIPSPMAHVLLGNSFLNRFQLRRESDVMTLELRY